MAYVLGFFAADGNMLRNKRGAHFIEFQITDKRLLEKIRRLLNSNHKIATCRKSNKWKKAYRFQIGSKEIFNDLLKLGMTPKKSQTMILPKIPSKYFPHFVRGYFDGDGNVTICSYVRIARNGKKYRTILSGFVCGSKIFLEKLHAKLKGLSNIKGGTLYFHAKGHRLFFSVQDSLALYNFIYKNLGNNLYLNRKKRIFEKYFENR